MTIIDLMHVASAAVFEFVLVFLACTFVGNWYETDMTQISLILGPSVMFNWQPSVIIGMSCRTFHQIFMTNI